MIEFDGSMQVNVTQILHDTVKDEIICKYSVNVDGKTSNYTFTEARAGRDPGSKETYAHLQLRAMREAVKVYPKRRLVI